MKEITRIHLAKIPYDIEVQARKELEGYIKKLELYSDDENLLEDIEIRMTEIIGDRQVEKNGLITSDDVAAIKEQLGEPKDFWGEGDIAVGPTSTSTDEDDRPRRRLYRDLDNAVLGGVLSGIAKFFDISPLWTRLAFLFVAAITFGAAIIVYLILWIIIPAARTAAEKLESAGKPITLASIKTMSDQEGTIENRIRSSVLLVIRYTAAAALAVSSLAILAVTTIATIALLTGSHWFGSNGVDVIALGPWQNHLAIGLLASAGVLLASLLAVLAIALFKKKWAKRLTIATIIIVVAGILTAAGGTAIAIHGAWQQSMDIQNSKTVERSALPAAFKNVTNLTSDAVIMDLEESNLPVYVSYIVSTGTPRYEVISASNSVRPVITVDGTSAKITVDSKSDMRAYYIQPAITIYGPALSNVDVKAGSFQYSNKEFQEALTIHTDSQQPFGAPYDINNVSGAFTLFGTYKTVTVTSDNISTAILDQATIENLNASLTSGYINAGVVKTLTATQPDACAASTLDASVQTRIVVRGVSSDTMTFNGKEQPATTISRDCGVLIIGNETDFDTAESNRLNETDDEIEY